MFKDTPYSDFIRRFIKDNAGRVSYKTIAGKWVRLDDINPHCLINIMNKLNEHEVDTPLKRDVQAVIDSRRRSGELKDVA
jgi:ubiquitin-protein ligase